MHPEKWLAHEPAMAVAAPTFATLGDGWKVADEDSEGELGARIAFEEWMDSEGCGGRQRRLGRRPRGARSTNGDRAAFAWRLRYDPGNDRTTSGRASPTPP